MSKQRNYSHLAARIVTSVSLEQAQVAALDARAVRQGVTRSRVLRSILDNVLRDELESPETISFPDLIDGQQPQRVINPRSPVRKLAP